MKSLIYDVKYLSHQWKINFYSMPILHSINFQLKMCTLWNTGHFIMFSVITKTRKPKDLP